VHHEPSAAEVLEREAERLGALRRVERERPLVPSRAEQSLRLVRLESRSRGNDQDVVSQDASVAQPNPVSADVDLADLGLVEDDPPRELAAARPHDLVETRQSE